jgi:hypothetical protein
MISTIQRGMVALAVALGALISTNMACAQESMFRLPFMAPSRPSLYQGAFYSSGGIKYRNLNTVKMNLYGATELDFSFGPEDFPFTNKFWTPVLEVGYQDSNFFDLFAGFSWYQLDNEKFLTQEDTGGLGRIRETHYKMRMEVYESRWGGRSWFPIFGFGRIATTLGITSSVVPFDVDVEVVNSGGDAVTTSQKGGHGDFFWHWGLIGGAEIEVDYNRFLAKAAFEYSVGTRYEYETLLGTTTEMNPAGFSMAFHGGMRF